MCSGSDEDYLEVRKVFCWIDRRKFIKVDDRTAEISKLTMNAFACTKVSFVNEIERICKLKGGDVEAVMEILRREGRCASDYSYPKKGAYAGKCLEKDIRELMNSLGGTILFKAVEEVNRRTKEES